MSYILHVESMVLFTALFCTFIFSNERLSQVYESAPCTLLAVRQILLTLTLMTLPTTIFRPNTNSKKRLLCYIGHSLRSFVTSDTTLKIKAAGTFQL